MFTWKSFGFYCWGLFAVTLFVLSTADRELDFWSRWLINIPFYIWMMVVSVKLFPRKEASGDS